MPKEYAQDAVQISQGDGIVAHLGALTAFAKGDETRLNELVVRLNALAGASWQETVRTITSGISETGFDDHPSVACVSIDANKISALVFGPVELSIVLNGDTTVFDGRDSTTWIDVVLRGDVERVHAGSKYPALLLGVLRDGVVPAGGFLYQPTGPLPALGQWDSAVKSLGSPADEETGAETAAGG